MLSIHELERQQVEPLPDRELMSLLSLDLSAFVRAEVALHPIEVQANVSVDAEVAVGGGHGH